MISREIDFHAPKTLPDALKLLAAHGGDAKVLAGGMSLVPMLTLGLAHPEIVISLNHVPGLDQIKEDGGSISIGALARHHSIKTNPLIAQHAPLLAEAAGFIGDVQVRHRGTIGGALVHADPAADYLPVMLALGAKFRLQNATRERVVDAAAFFKDIMTTAIEDGELLVEVKVPKLPAGTGTSYQRLHRVEGNYAIVAAAAVVEPGKKKARIGFGGTGPTPVLIDVSAHVAAGVNDEALRKIGDAAVAAAENAYGDLNGDAKYKQAMARVYAQRVIRTAADKAR